MTQTEENNVYKNPSIYWRIVKFMNLLTRCESKTLLIKCEIQALTVNMWNPTLTVNMCNPNSYWQCMKSIHLLTMYEIHTLTDNVWNPYTYWQCVKYKHLLIIC